MVRHLLRYACGNSENGREDRPFLEAAVYADALLLTNNLKDYPFLGVTVLAPEELLAWCEERGI